MLLWTRKRSSNSACSSSVVGGSSPVGVGSVIPPSLSSRASKALLYNWTASCASPRPYHQLPRARRRVLESASNFFVLMIIKCNLFFYFVIYCCTIYLHAKGMSYDYNPTKMDLKGLSGCVAQILTNPVLSLSHHGFKTSLFLSKH